MRHRSISSESGVITCTVKKAGEKEGDSVQYLINEGEVNKGDFT